MGGGQDFDGSHIKGLILNYLDHFFPSLLRIPNFLVEFVTPIVRVSPALAICEGGEELTCVEQVTKGREKINFFTIPEYEQWIERTPDVHKWKAKYYKVRRGIIVIFAGVAHDCIQGLGTSKDEDARVLGRAGLLVR